MKSCKTLTVGLVCWSLVLLAGCGSDTFEQIGAVGAPVTRDGPLAIDDVTPRHGVVDSDTVVMIRGKGFGEGTWVYFGDTPAEEVLVLNDGILTALTPSHGTGKVDVRVQAHIEGQTHEVALQDGFDFVVIPVSAGEVDTDGDGLTDAEELAGWDIKVDIFGFGLDPGQFGQFLEFHVASDPNDPDSDDDGLSDRDEFFVKANPTDEDTDGDGLWDGEEWFRWLTSPISVDTDGDARDNDPSSERSPLPPNAGLFDGAELYSFEELVKDPVDRGDIRFNATSPTLDDTDGDNVRDFDEVDTPVRTPLLADMPQLLFEIVDEVDIRLDVEYAEEEGKSTAFESSFSTSQSQTNSTSNTVSASVTVGAEVEIGLTGGVSASVEVTAGYEHSWGTESTSASEQTVSQLEEKSRAFTETSATGSMAAGIKVSNIGNISVQVVDLGWTARQWRPNTNFDRFDTSPGEYRTFAALGVDLGPGLTLAPGADSGVLLASADDLNADRVKEFMAKPDSLQLEPAAFELINSEGINFAFIEEITRARTARVTIDFGDSSFEEYRVATNVDRNADGTLAGIKMAKVMDLTVGPGNWETRPAVPPCDNLIVNGSFESPEGSGEPDDWNVRELGDGSGEVSVLEGLDPPDGDQWLEFRNNTTGAKAISQMIGTVQDNAEHSYSLWDAVNDSPPWLYGVSIWAGDPASGGTLLDEDIILTTGEPEAPSQVTGMLNTGAGFEGQDLYVEIRHLPGEFAILLIDDFNISGPGGSLGVLWRVRDVSTELDATPRFWFVVVSGENVDDTLPFEDTVLRNGDSVLIALTQDEDGDGLYAAQEQQYGTLDDVRDTDGDGLTDPEEAARTYIDQQTCEILEGGWEVVVTDRSQNVTRSIVYSDPRVRDSDLDGVSDGDERLGLDGLPPDDENDSDDATDPNRRDTDLDGLTDDVDPLPTIQAAILFVKEGNGGTNGNDWGDAFSTIFQAVAVANARNADQDDTNDVSEIWVTAGTYLQVNTPLPDSAAIYGGFSGIETRLGQRVADGLVNGSIIVGAGGTAFLLPSAGAAVSSRLDGFTIQNSLVGMTLESVGSTVEVANCFFAQNVSIQSDPFFSGGSAIRALGVDLTLDDCIFSENVSLGNTENQGKLTAGAVATNGGSLTIRRCTFLQNTTFLGLVGNSGGAVFAIGNGSPNVSIENTTFTNNTSVPIFPFTPGRGGAVYLAGVKANVMNCSFGQNAVDQGTLLGGFFSSVRAGGAVALVNTDANFVNSQFIGNRAPMFGGGLFADTDSKARVVNCSFFENEAYADVAPDDTVKPDRGTCFPNLQISPLALGGAIGSEGSTTIENTAIFDNLATQKVELRIGGPIEIGNWGVEQQVAGGPQVRLGGLTCLSSLGSVQFAHSAVPTVAGYNKSVNVDATISSSVFSGVSNIVPEDPGFVNADGGNLRLTSSSPLIDAGNQIVDVDFNIFGFQLLPLFDFDGNFRITDGDGSGGEEVDIGAFEFQGGE